MKRAVFLLWWIFVLSAATGLADSANQGLPTIVPKSGRTLRWARLQTANRYWDRHAQYDDTIIALMRRSCGLAFDETPGSTTALKIEDLSRYPFLYCSSIAALDGTERKNLAEYLRRGGFIFIDACRNTDVNPSIDWFLKAQVAQFAKEFSDLKVGKLQPQHEVFSVFFRMHDFPPFRRTDGPEPLYGLISGGRMIAIISLSGFQCAWSGYGDSTENEVESLHMVANIYIYAMTH
jgi:hypothetical protein